MKKTLAIGLLSPLLLLAGCKRGHYDTPENAYAAFVLAIQKDDKRAAFESLSTPTREELERQATAISRASGGAIKADAAGLAILGQRREATKVERVSATEDHAVLKVIAPDLTHEVNLVKEPAGWRLELPPPPRQP